MLFVRFASCVDEGTERLWSEGEVERRLWIYGYMAFLRFFGMLFRGFLKFSVSGLGFQGLELLFCCLQLFSSFATFTFAIVLTKRHKEFV